MNKEKITTTCICGKCVDKVLSEEDQKEFDKVVEKIKREEEWQFNLSYGILTVEERERMAKSALSLGVTS